MIARRAPARRDDPTPRFIPGSRPRRAAIVLGWGFSLVLALAAAWGTGAPARAQESPGGSTEPAIPEPVGFVNDHAGKLDEETTAKLEAFLDQLKQKTGAEFAVLIMPTTAPTSPSEYKVAVFQKWGLGKKGEDNGLLMLIAIEEREVRFETGYGLEGVLPDGLQSRIFREEMAPRFREGDWSGGVVAGVLACAQRIAADKGVTLEWDGRELRYNGGGRGRSLPWPFILALVVFLAFMIWAANQGGGGRPRRRGGWYMGPGGFGGWGGLGGLGGGFGGGGGGFGGGSFGGFGGGSSGGGGGGGKW